MEFFGEAFGTDCEKSKSWTVNDYKIQEYKCLGWAGPHYYPLYLYDNEKKISENGYKIDSCLIRFKPQKDLVFVFNICDNQLTELKPEKKTLRISEIDSVVMLKIEIGENKKLTREEIKEFVERWNNAPVFDYRDNKNPFYPNSSYFIKVFCNNDIREFETGNFIIKDSDNWTYNFLESIDETRTIKFDEMWERLKLPQTKNIVHLPDTAKNKSN